MFVQAPDEFSGGYRCVFPFVWAGVTYHECAPPIAMVDLHFRFVTNKSQEYWHQRTLMAKYQEYRVGALISTLSPHLILTPPP